jgi:hypothetical protein
MMTSDDAIHALMAKHISEGKTPPICMYGQLYLGSLSSHAIALAFKIFGPSVFVLKLATLFFYLGFIVVQFVLLKRVFSSGFALASSLFFCLPIGKLVTVSFDNTASFPLVLLLGASLMLVAHAIAFMGRESWIPLLGFLMGLSFWTHQITVSFILAALLLFVLRFKASVKKYLRLALFAVLGLLPLVPQEIYFNFHMAKFLSAGKKEIWSSEKLKGAAQLARGLISQEASPSAAGMALLLLTIPGLLILIFLSIRKKSFAPFLIYPLHFILFVALYMASGFSGRPLVRYLYPLYFSLPVVLLAVFWPLRARWRNLCCGILVLAVFVFLNFRGNSRFIRIVKESDQQWNQVTARMEQTGHRYWRGEFWVAYVISALTQEKIIVDSTTVNRYYPYRLAYYNQEDQGHFIFPRGPETVELQSAGHLINLLEVLGIPYEKQKVGNAWLVFNIRSPVYDRVFIEPVPSFVPQLKLEDVKPEKGTLLLAFSNSEMREAASFRLNVEIPGFSKTVRRFPGNLPEVIISIPAPPEKALIRYYLDYSGLIIPASLKETSWEPPPGEILSRQQKVVYLSGFSPVISVFGRRMRICEREARLEINGIRQEKGRNPARDLLVAGLFQHRLVRAVCSGDLCQGQREAGLSGQVEGRIQQPGDRAGRPSPAKKGKHS